MVDEEEYARIMARFDELEIEELKEESEKVQANEVESTQVNPEFSTFFLSEITFAV